MIYWALCKKCNNRWAIEAEYLNDLAGTKCPICNGDMVDINNGA
jgi:Zn finger protein HypA/HybF involved in hydrogenase expression